MSAPLAPPTLEQILGPALAAQCRLVPPPADLRGHVLAKINKWVPEGEDVAAWLLANHQPPAATSVPPAPVATIAVRCREEGTARGTCSYTESYAARGTIRISEAELQALIREAGSREEALEAFKEWVDDNFCADDTYDDYDRDYDNHEEIDLDTDSRSDDAEEVLEAYLDEHPELLPPENAEVAAALDLEVVVVEDEDEDDGPEEDVAAQRLADQLDALLPNDSPAPLATEEPHDP